MQYDLLLPQRVVFGWGRLAEAGGLAAALGRRALVVSGARHLSKSGDLDRLHDALRRHDVASQALGEIHREPCVDDVDELTAAVRQHPDDTVLVGIGGGAALDLAKALSAMATNRHLDSVQQALEGVGDGSAITLPPLPMLAIPTTAGTGSECTKNAVISSPPGATPAFKKSLRSDLMVPRAVLVDPALTVSVPAAVTARTGMDAITQLVEPLISCRAQPHVSALARHGLSLAVPMIERAVVSPADRPAREAMAHAACLSGICLANAGLGMAHGVAAALGIHAGVPHGLACAMMLPAALACNAAARPTEIAWLAGLFADAADEAAADAAQAAPLVRQLNARLGLPSRLGEVGVAAAQLPAIVRSARGNSMNGNPRPLSDDELLQLLTEML